MFGGFFLYNGIHHFTERKSLSQYAGAKQIPAPKLAVTGSGLATLAGGASVLLGIKRKLGTLAIIGFPAGVSPLMHDLWRVDDPDRRMNEMVNFSKNLALLGASLVLMAVEKPWPVSLPFARPTTVERVERIARRIAA